MARRTIITICSILIAALIGYFFWGRQLKQEDSDLIVPVKKGNFEISITSSGELEAKNSTKITGPSSLRMIQVYQVKISDLVAEGTLVKKGDYVAALDKSEISNKLKDSEIELQKRYSQITQTQLDTSLTLRQARDELINLSYGMKEKKIILEQSKFEPPATIRQVEMDLEKAERAYSQAKENYKIKKKQAAARIEEVSSYISQEKRRFDQIQEVIKEFTITAPENGMIIYDKDWNGRKKTKGSSISMWEPTVATLPDFSIMLSKTYVNEVDIRKIKSGQHVQIGLDAFPEKRLTGKVISVANVGEQKPNSDAKVFEVEIQINEKDTILRPAMTTSNTIIAEVVKDALFVPLECIHTQNDTLTYVFKKEGTSIVKQQVEIGKTNENEVIILAGLTQEDKLYLSVPKKAEDKNMVYLENKKIKTSKAKIK